MRKALYGILFLSFGAILAGAGPATAQDPSGSQAQAAPKATPGAKPADEGKSKEPPPMPTVPGADKPADKSEEPPSTPTVPGTDKSAEADKAENRTLVGGAPLAPHAYVIGPEDVIFVRVWREAELSGQFSVRPDGKISLPLINEVTAAGMTPEKLSAKIAADLSACCMVKPEVTVSVQQVNSKKYFIQGEVQKPGAYPLLVPTTVLEALVNAGGFREFANKKKIIILRKTERLKFNYNDVIKGKNMAQNILLQPGDQIIVP